VTAEQNHDNHVAQQAPWPDCVLCYPLADRATEAHHCETMAGPYAGMHVARLRLYILREGKR
jgi:hypothetical protein